MATGKAGRPWVSPVSYYAVFEFMTCEDGLGLKGAELGVYALVYSYSHGRGGCYYASNAMTAHRVGCTERHAIDVLHKLEAQGLIAKVGTRSSKGRSTNMYAAVEARASEAIARCGLDAGTGELASGVLETRGRSPEIVSSKPLNPVHPAPEESSPDKKGIANRDRKGASPFEQAGGFPGDGDAAALPAALDEAEFKRAFSQLLRGYPYCRDPQEARGLYLPLYLKGVRAEHVSQVLGIWGDGHPPRQGRGQFYPDLARFLDPNNPEGYEALAAKRQATRDAKLRRHVRELTLNDSTSDIYERYTLDGCDARAAELWQAHLESDGEGVRGHAWDVWYQHMLFRCDADARLHWLRASGRMA